MLPLSYQGFGFTAILLMVLILSVVEGVKYIRGRMHRHTAEAKLPEPIEPLEQLKRNPDSRP
ncbi:MAG: hypothetical protein Q8927_01565 [Bacteroidota bacterium]|nr:hypothetical protein [Bacteroidota bacterium]MDP4214858.1 hypothetical protein [Bacteroidota bacterium]MDP4246734.1 hypothetical protein [Bacteroidota bacterium]MDP4254913.1 hypothetical protein [Bacteroidota bacterium]MDP4257977.1 hypothetical protein [Bacteroidota bacterium]